MTTSHAPSSPNALTTRLRRAFRYRGLLVLVLWQAPVQPVIRPNGSLGLVVLGGSDERVMMSCDGSVIESDEISYRGAALEADYDLAPDARIIAAAGYTDSDWASHRGPFGGVQVRKDWGGFGLGLGIGVLPDGTEEDPGTEVLPSVHLRAGRGERFHARFDLVPPNALGHQQIARIGLGWNTLRRDKPSVFFGLAGLGLESGASGVAADLTLPTSSRFALRAQGHYGPGEAHAVAGIAVGGSFLFGGAPRLAGEVQTVPAPQ